VGALAAGATEVAEAAWDLRDTGPVSFDPYSPYGVVVESTVRVVTWNVWGRYGPAHDRRQAALEEILATVAPDVVCLIEAWRHSGSDQSERIAKRLGLPYHYFAGDWRQEDWVSGIGLVCRWPMSEPQHRSLQAEDGTGDGQVLHVTVTGDRGPIQLFAVMLDYPLHASATRQDQVRQLVRFISEVVSRRDLVIVCGDFNAAPDSDEIRMLTGRAASPSPGMVFYDSWEVAGGGSPGYTWSNANPLAAAGLLPDRRFDYVFSAWPRRGGAGHPVSCQLLGQRPRDQDQVSDHYGLVADLRY
jgi:endonuclease/exonuclease/phosphatase family metal-dependent hydrolase